MIAFLVLEATIFSFGVGECVRVCVRARVCWEGGMQF